MRAHRRALGAAGAAAVVAGLVGIGLPGASATAGSVPVTVAKTVTLPTGSEPYAVGVDSRRHVAYIGGGNGQTWVMNTITGAMTTLLIPSDTDSIAVDQATGLAYIPAYTSPYVSVLRGTTVVGTVATGVDPDDAVIDPVTGLVYVDNYHDGTITVIKGTKVVGTVTVGGDPEGSAVDPATGYVYIPNETDGTVSVIKGTTVVKTITVGSEPSQVAVDPSRHLAYVSNENAGTVSVITGDSTTTQTATVGTGPYGVVVNPTTHYAYVASDSAGTGSVAVLDGATVKATIPTSSSTYDVAFDPTNGLVLAPGQPSVAIRGTTAVQSVTALSRDEGFAQFDTSNGRAVVSNYDTSTITLVQTPTPATIRITRPTAGVYAHGTTTTARYRCIRGANNPLTSCDGTVADGHRLPHSPGRHTFTVHAHSAYGTVVTQKVHYRVAKKK